MFCTVSLVPATSKVILLVDLSNLTYILVTEMSLPPQVEKPLVSMTSLARAKDGKRVANSSDEAAANVDVRILT